MKSRSNLRDNTSYYSINEQFKVSKSRVGTFRNMETLSESDEELTKVELENAVKEYKKNKSRHYMAKCDSAPKSNKIKEKRNFLAKNFDDSENCWIDWQDLMNYFLTEKSPKEKLVTKSYNDYEEESTIPKRKTKSNSSEEIQPKGLKTNSKKKYEKKPEIQFGENQRKNKSFCIEPKISESESSLYNFIVNPSHDDVIVKINEKICSSPFYYMVPNDPSPNFFLSPGSYYIIPRTPNSLQENVIIFHPERTVSAGYDEDDSLLEHEKKLSRNITKSVVSRMNNLGKEVSRKEDSHLNISPLEAKLHESFINFETSCASNKTYEKALLNFSNFKALNRIQRTKSKMELTDRPKKSDFKVGEGDPMKDNDRLQILRTSPLKRDEKNLNERNAKSNIEKKRDEQQIGQKLLEENLSSDQFTEVDTVSDLSDTEKEPILANERLMERMLLALPEIEIEELQEKFFEFQGDENLIENYIQETKEIMRIRQLVLDMQFIFPDADPDFLQQEIEKLKNDEDAVNILIEELLDTRGYPKIFENNPNNERANLWQKYVENFSIKNFILNVPNPKNFAGPNGDNNGADMQLILKFLISRYPLQSEDFLEGSFRSYNNNLTKTCTGLSRLKTVRLSESCFKLENFNEAFLKEICYIDHKEEIDSYLDEVEERKNLEIEEARLNNTFLSCPLCAEVELVASEVITCSEGHVFCKECIKRYISVKLGDGIYKFLCPLEKCDTFFPHATLKELLSESVFLNIIKKQQAEEINNAKLDGLEFCPHCEFAYIPNLEDKIFKCQNPECLIETCRKCQEKNHIPFRCEEIERSIDVEARKKIEETMTEQLIRSCPTCLKKFIKIDGCNLMKCSCRTIVCYVCRQKIKGYDHFGRNFTDKKCPLYSNNEILHTAAVFEAGVQTRNDILRDNPNIRIVHDPTLTEI